MSLVAREKLRVVATLKSDPIVCLADNEDDDDDDDKDDDETKTLQWTAMG